MAFPPAVVVVVITTVIPGGPLAEVVVIPLGLPEVVAEHGLPEVVEGIRPHMVLVEELAVVCRVTWLTIQSILRTYLTLLQPEQCRA